MNDAALYNAWFLALAAAVVVVLIAAALLLAVFFTARSIEQRAAAGLELVKEIRENTQVIWALQETNQTVTQLQAGAEAILHNAGRIVRALHDADARAGR
jgi:Tfp pilus assembly protein PilN